MKNKNQPQTLKGFRDFFPEDALKRNFVISKITQVFDLYGFEPLETPAIEYLETFTGNIGEDEKLFFRFEDQGGRKVALRYDQTVPTCRLIGQYRNKIQFPFKRYQIQTVWRAEKPQKGRYREFLQCDADIFGVTGAEADAEIIALCIDIYKKLGFKEFKVKINDRALFESIPYPVIVAIDKLSKIGKDGVIKEITGKGFSEKEAQEILERVLDAKPNKTILKIFDYLKNLGFSEDLYVFDPSIARSFNYSTGPIWEVVIPGFMSGSVLGGERFDKLVGRFLNEDIPGTGFGLGFDRTLEAMEQFNLIPKQIMKTKVLVTVFSAELMNKSLEVVSMLRKNNINTDIYSNVGAKLDKQLKYADNKKIPYVVIIGPEEAEKKIVKLKDMSTGEQKEMTLEQLISFYANKS